MDLRVLIERLETRLDASINHPMREPMPKAAAGIGASR
jgi:hypothetical protein